MKKIQFGILSFFAVVFFAASVGVTSAETRALNTYMPYSDDSVMVGGTFNGVTIDLKTRAELEAKVKAGNARCASITDEAKRKICAKELELEIRSKIQAVSGAKVDGKVFSNSYTGVSADGEREISTEKRENENPKDRMERVRGEFKKFFGDFSGRFEEIISKLTAVHDRIDTLATRVESRIKKLSAENVDVSVSTKSTSAAREELKLALASIEEAKATFKEESSSAEKNSETESSTVVSVESFQKCKAASGSVEQTRPLRCTLDGIVYLNADTAMSKDSDTNGAKNFRTSFAKTIENVKEVKEHLKSAHRHLVEAIRNLKPGINKVETSTSADVETSQTN